MICISFCIHEIISGALSLDRLWVARLWCIWSPAHMCVHIPPYKKKKRNWTKCNLKKKLHTTFGVGPGKFGFQSQLCHHLTSHLWACGCLFLEWTGGASAIGIFSFYMIRLFSSIHFHFLGYLDAHHIPKTPQITNTPLHQIPLFYLLWFQFPPHTSEAYCEYSICYSLHFLYFNYICMFESLSNRGFPHYPKVERSYETFYKPKWH